LGRIIRPSNSAAASEEPPSYDQSVRDDPVPPVQNKKTIYIRKVELTLNGVPIGRLYTFSKTT